MTVEPIKVVQGEPTSTIVAADGLVMLCGMGDGLAVSMMSRTAGYDSIVHLTVEEANQVAFQILRHANKLDDDGLNDLVTHLFELMLPDEENG